MTIDYIRPETGFDISNELDIEMRQKTGSEISWATVMSDPSGITTKFDLCPPVGNHKLIMESIDKNSPLLTPSVLKTDVIDLYVAAATTNKKAFKCGQLPASG